MIVAALLTAVLTGYIGSSVEATVLLYTAEPIDVVIQGKQYFLEAGNHNIPVSLPVKTLKEEQSIIVSTDNMQYNLPLTVIGKKDYSWLWWLLLAPVACLLLAVRFRRIGAGSS